MEFIKDKYFFWGILTGLMWTGFGVLVLIFFLSEISIEESIISLYKQKKIGGLISLAALINLPIFFIALRRNKFSFAAGLVSTCLILVLLITFLKLNI